MLIHRQQFDIVYKKCIMLKTKVFMCDMSEKYVIEKCYQKILCYKCLVKQVCRVGKFQMTGCVLDKEL